jgi:hypothetical protein
MLEHFQETSDRSGIEFFAGYASFERRAGMAWYYGDSAFYFFNKYTVTVTLIARKQP